MAGFNALAQELLKANGFEVQINNFDNTDFDIEEGESIKTLTDSFPGYAIFTTFERSLNLENSYQVEAGDKSLLLSVDIDKNVNNGSKITINSNIYKICYLSEVKDVLETALYKLIIKEV